VGNVGFDFPFARDFVRYAYKEAISQGTTLVAFLESKTVDRVDSVADGSAVKKVEANGTSKENFTNTDKSLTPSALSKISDVLLTFCENAPETVDTDLKLKGYLIRKLMEAEYKYRSQKFFKFEEFVRRRRIR
jgi:N-acyl-D-aspartate/D-glutamate deacylase